MPGHPSQCFLRSDWAELCAGIPALPLVILRPVELPDSSWANPFRAVMQDCLFQVWPTHRRHHKDFLG